MDDTQRQALQDHHHLLREHHEALMEHHFLVLERYHAHRTVLSRYKTENKPGKTTA